MSDYIPPGEWKRLKETGELPVRPNSLNVRALNADFRTIIKREEERSCADNTEQQSSGLATTATLT